MFTIRAEQIKSFQPDAEDAFAGRIAEYLLKNHGKNEVRLPDADAPVAVTDLPEKTLRAMVTGGIENARQFGIEWKSNLIEFVVLMFLTAPNFSEYEVAGEMLRNDKFPPDLRVDKLMKRMTESDWEHVRSNYRSEIWNMPLEETN